MNDSKLTQNDIPDPQSFFLNTPPYLNFEITDDNYLRVYTIEYCEDSIDTYCHVCKKESTFKRINVIHPSLSNTGRDLFDISSSLKRNFKLDKFLYFRIFDQDSKGYHYEYRNTRDRASEDRSFTVEYRCTRCEKNILVFLFVINDSKILKVGQYPSLSDLERYKIQKYRKSLGKDRYRELSLAMNLNANGIGIGSFVYLRRIFEFLIENAHTEAKITQGWNDEAFRSSTVEAKILLLRDFLPSFLIQNRSVYSVLSKGIHELSEEECLEYFGPVKIIIELILDKKIELETQRKKEDEATTILGRIVGRLKS